MTWLGQVSLWPWVFWSWSADSDPGLGGGTSSNHLAG